MRWLIDLLRVGRLRSPQPDPMNEVDGDLLRQDPAYVPPSAYLPPDDHSAGVRKMVEPARASTKAKGAIGATVGAIIAAVFAVEGGFVDHPNDPGGATNFGVTERVARKHGFDSDMRELPREKAFEIYRKDYIERPGFMPLVEIDPAVAEEVIDTAVNMGPVRPSRYFQRAVNEVCGSSLAVDGRIGPATVSVWRNCRFALGAPACVRVLDSLDRQQEAEYDRLVRVNPRLKVFRRGWQNHRIGNVDRKRCQ